MNLKKSVFYNIYHQVKSTLLHIWDMKFHLVIVSWQVLFSYVYIFKKVNNNTIHQLYIMYCVFLFNCNYTFVYMSNMRALYNIIVSILKSSLGQ